MVGCRITQVRRIPTTLERGVGDIGETVLEAKAIELTLAANLEAEPCGPADRVDVPRGALAATELPVGGCAREVLGEPVLRPEQHHREVGPRRIGRKRPADLRVLEVCRRHPEHRPAVDDIRHVPGERREELLVDLERDVDVEGELDRGRDVLYEPRDHGRVEGDEGERVRRNGDSGH